MISCRRPAAAQSTSADNAAAAAAALARLTPRVLRRGEEQKQKGDDLITAVRVVMGKSRRGLAHDIVVGGTYPLPTGTRSHL